MATKKQSMAVTEYVEFTKAVYSKHLGEMVEDKQYFPALFVKRQRAINEDKQFDLDRKGYKQSDGLYTVGKKQKDGKTVRGYIKKEGSEAPEVFSVPSGDESIDALRNEIKSNRDQAAKELEAIKADRAQIAKDKEELENMKAELEALKNASTEEK